MITTRTRILSILATVAMLVSMLACFVIPASAAAEDVAPYAALLADIVDSATVAPTLTAAVESNADAGTLADALTTDKTNAGSFTFITFDGDNPGNELEYAYPRYAYKAVYDAAGYTDKVYSISAPADWLAMVAASEYTFDESDAVTKTGESFAGYVFHVTNDIDFDATPDNKEDSNVGIEMAPLSLGNGVYSGGVGTFQGTIQGHNHAFKNINVVDTFDLNTKSHRTTGLIGKLGVGAVIENFGVDSGTITRTKTTTKTVVAATFGNFQPNSSESDTWPRLNNVWSSADITVNNANKNYAAGIIGYMSLTTSAGTGTINGAYFNGTLTVNGTSRTTGIADTPRSGAIYNALNASAAIYGQNVHNSASGLVMSNIYSVNHTTDVLSSTSLGNPSNYGPVASPEEGAWSINKVQPAASGVAEAYFTWVTNSLGEKAIRPTGDETNRIVKVNVAGLEDPLYVNLNTTELTKAYLAELTENADIIGYKLDEGDEVVFTDTNYVELTGDEQTITFTMTAAGALDAAKEKYTNLLAYSQYLTEGAVNAINTFLNDEELTAGNLTEKEGTLIGQLETYYTYEDVDTDGKDIPGYSLVEELGEYNVHTAEGVAGKQVWAISAPEDWTAMVDASDIALGDDVETFENHIFHVTDNIDFDDPDAEGTVGIKMAPLSLGTGGNNVADGAFMGTIEGHGYAFENINVYDEIKTGANRVSGLIGKLGDGAVINDFGVASGTIELTGENTSQTSVATFGEGAPSGEGAVPQLNRVWSNANIILSATSTNATNYASGLIANGGDNYGGVTINGAYFSGTLTNDIDSSKTVGIYRNFKTGTVYNALSNPAVATYALQRSSSATGTHENIFSVNYDPYSDFDSTTDTKNGNAASALAGAWAINNAQTTEDEIADVYFTKDGENIRFGNVDNRIVKVSVNEGEKEIYLNNGETLDKAYFADLYEVGENAITINDDASVAEVTANGDTAVAITVDYDAELANVRDKYDDLLAMYLTDTAAGLLDTFLNSTEDAQAVLATEGDLITALTGGVYTTYPATDAGKAVPGYKDVELYGAYNTANVWTINSTEDWLKMVADSNAETDPATFAGYEFHVTGNIDFSTETDPMDPLAYNEKRDSVKNVNNSFQGTIDGHNYAFSNIHVKVDEEVNEIYTGMIGKLGPNAWIKNFGVDSGIIEVTEKATTAGVATFGEALHQDASGDQINSSITADAGNYAKLDNVWSGATIKARAATSNVAGFVVHSQYSEIHINGAYFFGTLDSGNANAYGLVHQIRDVSIGNALIAPKAEDGTTITAANSRGSGVYFLGNGYSVGYPLHQQTGDGVSVDDDKAANRITNSAQVTADELEYAAWMINSNQPVKSYVYDADARVMVEDVNLSGVYFTITGKDEDGNNIIRPYGTADNKIVKVTVNDEPEYVNVGTTLDKAYFVDLFGVSEAAITSITVGEEDYTATGVAAADGLAVTVVLDEAGALQAQLNEKVAEYDGLDVGYFKTTAEINETGKIGLAEFLNLAASNDVANLNKAIDAITDSGDWTLVDEITTDYTRVPAYKLHATYEAYNAGKNWQIVDKDDWYKMEETAENTAANSKYFEGHTFHLIDDVDFEQNGDTTDSAENDINVTFMRPLGSKVVDGEKIYFAGTINGHGFGFENVYVRTFSNSTANIASGHYDANKSIDTVGLISAIVNAKFVDFGINSGTISGGSAGNAGNASTFGGVYNYNAVDSEVEYVAPQFTRVWSGATIRIESHGHMSALVGTYNENNAIIVDGFTFYGSLVKTANNARNMAYGVYGGNRYAPADGSTFKNILTYPTLNISDESVPASADDVKYTSAIFGFSSEEAYIANAANMSNVYGIGFDKAYRGIAKVGDDNNDLNSAAGRVFYDDPNILITGMTAEQKAYEMNEEAAQTGVYFKLAADGGIRPTDSATNKLVKVEATVGEEPKTAYINANQAYTNTELRDALGYGVDTTITNVEVTSGGEYAEGVLTVTGDAVITVTIDVCEHTDVRYEHNGKNSHTATCEGCGYVFEAEACEKNWVAGEVNADGTSTHKATCPDCEHEYVEECNGTLSQTNCLEDGTWEFECEFHTGTYPATGTAKESHNWGGWTQVDGVENKFCRECTDCDVKEYKLLGEASATGVELYCKENGTITITLPENLASADLTFAIEGEGYTITEVAGATKDGDVYKVSGSTSVTVTIAADVTAVGGTFNVAVANAKDAEGTAIEFAGATATIGFTSIEGDANGDKTVNLADALAALYKVAQKPGAADINVENADIDGTEGFTINDVYAIVREWLRTTLEA